MTDPNFFIIYVDNPESSAEFYSRLLGKPPLETSPTFAMFSLDTGVMLGLWSKHTVEPASNVTGGGCEIAFSMESNAEVDRTYANWQHLKVKILQTPTQLDFGYAFVGLDPDGHRLRPFAASQA
jgi:predicted enzyme related to lactoylglutathione lyase